ELRLDALRLGDEEVAVLAAWPFPGGLATLSLRANMVGDTGAVALAGARTLSRLRTLNLDRRYASGNPLTEEGVLACLRSPHLIELCTLTLSQIALGDDGVEAIADCPELARFTNLDLSHCGLTEAGVVGLSRSPFTRNLTSLCLDSNALGDAAAAA